MLHFTEFEKLWVLFLMPDLILKLQLKPNALISTTVARTVTKDTVGRI